MLAGTISSSPLLFNGWDQAKVGSYKAPFNKDSLFYNFDKQSQKLLATLDGEAVSRFDRREFKAHESGLITIHSSLRDDQKSLFAGGLDNLLNCH